MILLGLLALALASEDDTLLNFGRLDATTLFFHERTLTKSGTPVPQLVCKNTQPADGCALRRIVFAECHKAATDDWDAWRCEGHGDEKDVNNPTGLELHMLAVRCTNNAVESCSLMYTLRYNNATLERMESKRIAGVCKQLYDKSEGPFRDIGLHNFMSYGLPAWVCSMVFSLLLTIAIWASVGRFHLVVTRIGTDTYYSLRRRTPDEPADLTDAESAAVSGEDNSKHEN